MDYLIEKNQKRIEKLNLPSLTGKDVKILIFDEYTPYPLDILPEMKLLYVHKKEGMHGTWCAQIPKMIAPDVELHGCGYNSDVGIIIDYAIENDIKIISASMNIVYSAALDAAIKRYYDWGGIFVTTSGNDDGKPVRYPGSSPYTICVSATDSWSNYGREIDVTADSYWYVRNMAPGTYHSFPGTSSACPAIAGCIALMLEKYPYWECEDVRRFLKENSVSIPYAREYERFFSFPEGFGDAMKIEMYIGRKEIIVDGVSKEIDTAPFLQDSRTFVPIRFVAEELGCEVGWDERTGRVTITK